MKNKLFYISLFLLLSTIGSLSLFSLINDRKEELLQIEKDSAKVQLNTIIEAFRVHSNILYFNRIDTKKIKELLLNVNEASSSKQNEIRKELYLELIDMYNNMHDFKLKQLHFHLKNNDSFLRFHRPEKFGDNLADVRETVKYVNKYQKPAHGFEEGRIYNGYRFVYPLKLNDKYIGSVETSVSMEDITNEFRKEFSKDIDFIIKKSVVDKKVFSSEKDNYKECTTSTLFYHEKSISKGRNSLIESIISKYNKNNNIDDKLKEGELFNFFIKMNENYYVTTFLPIHNFFKNETVGYIIIIKEHNSFITYEKQYYLFLTFLIFFTMFIVYFMYKIDDDKHELMHNNKILDEVQKISHIGYWEFDLIKNRLIWSDEIYNIFDLEKAQFEASHKSILKYVHHDDLERVSNAFYNSIESKTDYRIEYKIITKNNELKHISELCKHTLADDGNIIQSLGTIHDITVQKEAYNKLYKFIDTQNTIVILTNGEEINFANKEFLNFFGFKELEDFKKESKCICEFFLENDRFFHLGKLKNNENWIDAIISLSQPKRIVGMLTKDSIIVVFSITLNYFEDDLYIVSFSDISQTINEQIILEEKTVHDKLTGAYNREYFEKNYRNIIKEYHLKNYRFALCLFDIDDFKKVNDTYGHDIGDYVLKELVSEISKFSRDDDILIRWGGEEFILIMKIKSENDLSKVLEHLRMRIEKHIFKKVEKVTCSFGVTFYKEGEDIETTIKRADLGLYEAKAKGKNQVIMI
ncbi:diguanylate cyclase [bacterium]|nr:diguanylate cyclase [bacterium]